MVKTKYAPKSGEVKLFLSAPFLELSGSAIVSASALPTLKMLEVNRERSIFCGFDALANPCFSN
ncbi:MAG: hypothetical protein JEZ00_14090 [Anaerolineaceae bacterium]|nr:hypothetical protein [Anaerolineaceae bacterium]